MSWITSLKRWKFRRDLEQVLQNRDRHQSQAHNLLAAKRLCILFPVSSLEDRRQMDDYRNQRRKEGLKTELFGYVAKKTAPEGSNIPLFSKADLNWYGAPKPEFRKQFAEKSCDILLVLGTPDHQLFNYLAQIKKSGLRVGPYSEASDNPYDVLFDPGDGQRLDRQLKSVTSIFQIANATTAPV